MKDDVVAALLEVLDRSLLEDGADEDLTCAGLPALWEKNAVALITPRAAGVAAGFVVLHFLNELQYIRRHEWRVPLEVEVLTNDGGALIPGKPAARLTGSSVAILTLERSILNLLSRLSGIATLTKQHVDTVADCASASGSPVLICDTRKTTPGLRKAEKYAVSCGGGHNHRMGLADEAMIKDNHLALCGTSLTEAVLVLRANAGTGRLTVEVDTIEQCREALLTDCDCILLDNMKPDALRQCVKLRAEMVATGTARKAIPFEASGGVNIGNLREIAATGIERISIGALTHSAKALDLGMDLATSA